MIDILGRTWRRVSPTLATCSDGSQMIVGADAPDSHILMVVQNQVAAAKVAARDAEIAAVEATQHRAVRENALGLPGAAQRLAAIDAQIQAIRTKYAG